MSGSAPNGHIAHNARPTREAWARLLGGRLSPHGKTVRFDAPGDKAKRYSKTLTIAPDMPYGIIVEDPTGETDWRELQAYALGMAGIPLKPEHTNSGPRGNGKSHRLAGGPVVQEATATVGVPVGEE